MPIHSLPACLLAAIELKQFSQRSPGAFSIQSMRLHGIPVPPPRAVVRGDLGDGELAGDRQTQDDYSAKTWANGERGERR
jgi:hypothetical protein